MIVRCLFWIIYLALFAITIANYRLIVTFDGLRIWANTSETTYKSALNIVKGTF